MAPNWNDEFDFDDLQTKPVNKKQKQTKKEKKAEDDFFDLEDEVVPKKTVLPSINKKNDKVEAPPINKQRSNRKSNINYGDQEEIYEQVQEIQSPKNKSNVNKLEGSSYYEQLEDIEDIKPKIIQKNNIKNNQKLAKQIKQQEEFQESIKQIKQSRSSIVKQHIAENKKQNYQFRQKLKEQDQLSQEEEVEDYGQDFQEILEQNKEHPDKDSKNPKKSQTSVNLKTKDKNIKSSSKGLESNKLTVIPNKAFLNKETKNAGKAQPLIPKPPQKENASRQPSAAIKKNTQPHSINQVSQKKGFNKSASKKSLKSNDSRKFTTNSRVSQKNTSVFVANKHINLIQKQFPETEQAINQMNIDKIARINESIRQMIRKFNGQLNDLINKNMILLKEKPVEKQTKLQQKIKMLQQQLKSGQTSLQVGENDLERLKGRQGSLKQEEYQLIIEKQIQQTKQSINETTKKIAKLKSIVNSQGNKLSKHQIQGKISQQLHQIKSMLIQAKKQQQKNQIKLQKFQQMLIELQSKNADKQYQLIEQIDNAKQKGINLGVKQQLKKKYDEFKAKIASFQNHKRCLQGLSKTKCENLIHQNQQIKITIKSIESQINNFQQSTEHSLEQSTKLIQKAKQNPNISGVLSQNLQKILKSIQQNKNINYYQVRSEGNKSQSSDRPMKISFHENTHKEPTNRNNSNKKEPNNNTRVQETPKVDQINLMKPNFMKKKQKVYEVVEKQKQNKIYQRIWNQQENTKKQDKNKNKQEQAKKVELPAAPVQEEKKKPFTLKKNRIPSTQQTSPAAPVQQIVKAQPIHQIKTQKPQEVKQQQKPSLGPKFMKFSRKQKNNQPIKSQISQEKPIQTSKKVIEEPIPSQQNTAEEQPIFVPKRLNLRNKMQKKQQAYVPTVQKKEQPKQQKKQYTINFSFKEQEPLKINKQIQIKKSENSLNSQPAQQLPKFNLRLRDRQKKETNQTNDYVPSRLTEPSAKNQSLGYNPSANVANRQGRNPLIPEKDKEQSSSYTPSVRKNVPVEKSKQPEKDTYSVRQPANIIQPAKQPTNNPYVASVNNPYAPKPSVINPYAPKQPATNPYSPVPKQQNIPNQNIQPVVKRQREGPVKKIKILNKAPKQKMNIYQQAQDLTEPLQPINQPAPYQPPSFNNQKNEQIDLHAMLGIKKKQKPSDLDDLLGEIKVDKKKQKKKNNDFFNDLQL